MTFNELNSVGNFIVNKLTGVNLNIKEFSDSKKNYGSDWVCKSVQDLQRGKYIKKEELNVPLQ